MSHYDDFDPPLTLASVPSEWGGDCYRLDGYMSPIAVNEHHPPQFIGSLGGGRRAPRLFEGFSSVEQRSPQQRDANDGERNSDDGGQHHPETGIRDALLRGKIVPVWLAFFTVLL